MTDFVVKPNSTLKPKASQQHQHAHVETFTGPTPQTTGPLHDVIARRAYGIYMASGQRQGQCRQNWEQAECELQEQLAESSSQKQHQATPVGRNGFEPVVAANVSMLPSNRGSKGSKRNGAHA